MSSGRNSLGPMVLAPGHLFGQARRVVELEQLFDVFGMKHGDWRALALRLSYGRWPHTLVIDTRPELGRPPDPDIALHEKIFIQEITGIKCGCRKAVQQRIADGYTIPRIVAELNLPTKQVERIKNGKEMTDRAAVRFHLDLGGAMRGLRPDQIKKRVNAWATRHTRAIQTYGRPK